MGLTEEWKREERTDCLRRQAVRFLCEACIFP